MKAIRIGLALWMCLALWTCGSKQQSTTTVDSTAAVPVVEQPSEQWLVLKYDDVRLRATPSKGGEVLGSFKEGDQVLDLKERSENKETIVLRGESITAAWAKVRSKEGKEGWIFAGALGEAPDPAVAEFAQSLENIPDQDCKRIHAALTAYATAMKGKPAKVADQAVVPLFAYLDKVVEDHNQELGLRGDTKGLQDLMYPEKGKKIDPKAQAELKAWEDCGLHMTYPEGMLYLELKPGLCIPTLDPLVSDGMRRYLEIRKKEDANPWSEDASLLITPKELADRCVSWDIFLQDLPDFPFRTKIREQNHYYLGSLLMGQDNNSAFDYSSKKLLLPDFKAAWEWILESNPQTPTGKIVQQWCDMLKPAGWKMTPKSEQYIADFWKRDE